MDILLLHNGVSSIRRKSRKPRNIMHGIGGTNFDLVLINIVVYQYFFKMVYQYCNKTSLIIRPFVNILKY